jgi:3'(2'), 5'-bisphosphate nucleotidase
VTTVDIRADAQLEAMIDIARAASARALELYREHLAGGVEVHEKGPGDPVTPIDRELDAMIGAALAARFPDAGVLGEESAPASGDRLREQLRREEVFFVDPIDGTRELVARTGEFAVMIGLARGGSASAGVVAVPTEELILAGRVGQRAFVERNGARELAAVSTVDAFPGARMLVSRSHPPAIAEPLRRRLGVGTVVPCGSVGVKVARIALGLGEVYAHAGHGLNLWDTCAAEAVLVAAGGRLTDLDGARIQYLAGETILRRGLVASNAVLYPGVMSAVNWAEREAARISRI